MRVSFPAAGRYELEVYAKKQGVPGIYRSAVRYEVSASTGVERLFARHGEAWSSHGWSGLSVPDGAGREGVFVVKAQAGRASAVLGQLVDGSGQVIKHRLVQQRDGDRLQWEVSVPAVGNYELQVFSSDAADSALRFAFGQPLQSRGGSALTYPSESGIYGQLGARYVSPRSRQLRAGTSEVFDIEVPRADAVVVKIGDDWHELERSGQRFRGAVRVSRGSVVVMARVPPARTYSHLLEYQAQ